MLELEELKKKINEVLYGEEEEETVVESKPKTVVYDELPSVQIKYPEKPTVQTPTYERMEYVAPTDEEIEQSASKQLEEYKNTAMESYDKNFENTKSQKEQEKVVHAQEKTQKEKDVDEAFAQKAKDIDYDLIKRGMVNSSFSGLAKEKNEKDKADALSSVMAEYSQAIEKLDRDIAKAEAQRQEAVGNFNISYALKYANLVNKLKQERADTERKVIEYNNKIAQKEYDDQITKAKTESDLYSEALDQQLQEQVIENKQQYEVASSYNYRIYNILRNQLANMSKEAAQNAIKHDPTYVENLTTTYYLKLVEEFGG